MIASIAAPMARTTSQLPQQATAANIAAAYAPQFDALGATVKVPHSGNQIIATFPTGIDMQKADGLFADTVQGVNLVMEAATSPSQSKTPPSALDMAALAKKLPGVAESITLGPITDADLFISTVDQAAADHLNPLIADYVPNGMSRPSLTFVEPARTSTIQG